MWLTHFIKRMLAGNTARRASSHAQRSQRTLHPLPHAHRLLLGLRSICRRSCRTELRLAAAQTPTRNPGEQGSGWQAMRTGNSRPPHLLLRFNPYRWLWMLALRRGRKRGEKERGFGGRRDADGRRGLGKGGMEGDVVLNAEPPVRAGVGTEVDGLERPRPRRTPCDAAAAGPIRRRRRRARVGRRATGTGAGTAAGSVGHRLGGRREEWGSASRGRRRRD